MDFSALMGAAIGLAVFLPAHALLIRLTRRPKAGFLAAFALGLAACALYWTASIQDLSAESAAAITASLGLYLLAGVHFISWVYGMTESAVRVRLLAELAAQPQGRAPLGRLLARYNARVILERRLQRLTGAGILRQENGRYRIGQLGLLGPQILIMEHLARLTGKPGPGIR